MPACAFRPDSSSARIRSSTPRASAAPSAVSASSRSRWSTASERSDPPARPARPLRRLGGVSAGQDRRPGRCRRCAARRARARARDGAHAASRISGGDGGDFRRAAGVHDTRRCMADRRGCSRRARATSTVRARRAAPLCARRRSVFGPGGTRGATTRSASRRSRARPRTSALVRCPNSSPTSCTRTIGRRGWRRPICTTRIGPRPGTVMTVHNLAFQGEFGGDLLRRARPAVARVVDRRRRILRVDRLPQGRAAARRSHHDRVADVRGGNPHAGRRHGRWTACCAIARSDLRAS